MLIAICFRSDLMLIDVCFRSDLMLIDFKRATANKDLHRLMDDLERKRGMSQSYDAEMESKRSELRGFESLGITKEEVMKGWRWWWAVSYTHLTLPTMAVV